MRFFIEIGGRSEGPFTVEQIEALHGEGRINRATRCRPEGKGEWSSIYNLVPSAIWVTSPVSEPVHLSFDPPRRREVARKVFWYSFVAVVALLLSIPVIGIVGEELATKARVEAASVPAPPPLSAANFAPSTNGFDAGLRAATHSLDRAVDELAAAYRLMVVQSTVLVIVGLILFAFWLWMLVQVVTMEPEGSDKIVWTLVVVFTGPLGAAIYFLARYIKRPVAYVR